MAHDNVAVDVRAVSSVVGAKDGRLRQEADVDGQVCRTRQQHGGQLDLNFKNNLLQQLFL